MPLTRSKASFFGIVQRSCSSEKLSYTTYFAGNFFLFLAGRAKIGWHFNMPIVIRCHSNLLSLSFVMDICNFVRFLNIFLGSYGTEDFSKVTFETFEIDKILFIAFRVKLLLKKV